MGKAKQGQSTGRNTPRIIVLSERRRTLSLTTKRGVEKAVVIHGGARTSGARMTMRFTLAPSSSLAVTFVWEGKADTAITQTITVKAGAKLRLVNITRGSCTHDVSSRVTGKGGESRIDWVVHATGKMECALSAKNAFLASDGRGDLSLRGVAEGKARLVCNGEVFIGPKAKGTKAHLSEKILVLDPTARARAVPSLDVKTHDVEASHSASVSRIQPEDLFYFGSRGVTEKQARKLFIKGFLRY